uniref:Fibronectin type-III domain-containing protein n=1 Tax=Glossina brevipalpis TaxID=37001 RepID=A0A1A9W9T8_9MUSC
MGPEQRCVNLQQKFSINTTGTQVSFEDLHPCGKYNVSIISESKNGTKGPSINTEIVTKEGKPTKILHSKIVLGPHKLSISWSPPAYADLCLSGYRLSGWNDEKKPVPALDKTTENTSILIDGLHSCQAFIEQIITTTHTADDNPEKVETETNAIKAQAPSIETMGAYYNNYYILSFKFESVLYSFIRG